MIEINGALGEGGGQILRTALTLSLLTQTPIIIKNIRAKRPKPGLMRQHLACVKAAVAICDGQALGAELHSTELVFNPAPVRPGQYRFEIGSAGSTTLVFQTILLPLLLAEGESRVSFNGGTHNPLAPSLTEIKRGFIPILKRMGASLDITTEQWGFAPFGGGQWGATLYPSKLRSIDLSDRGELISSHVRCYISAVRHSVAERELSAYAEDCPVKIDDSDVRFPQSVSPGNVLAHHLTFENSTVCLSRLGDKRRSAENIAKQLNEQCRGFIASGAAVCEHLADQLMLPMWVAGGGRLTTSKLSRHSQTNIDIIKRITGKQFKTQQQDLKTVISL